MKDFNVDVGSRVKEKRLALKLTRDKLAHNASISNKFLYDIELGKKGMSAETLYKLAQALEVSADWLLGVE
jgi:transcriptional regulator with XRE-family HTH domain